MAPSTARRYLWAVLALCVAAAAAKPPRTLVSYMYFRPHDHFRHMPEKPYTKCGFQGGLCGCAAGYNMRTDSTSVQEAKVDLTPCLGKECHCEFNGGRLAVAKQCTSNVEFFAKHGVRQYLDAGNVDFLFNVPDRGDVPPTVAQLAKEHPAHVHVAHPPLASTDLCPQSDVVRQNIHNYTRFVLINCSGRGPYQERWLEAFEEKMVADQQVHLVGPVINCWIKQPHVQSWVWYADELGAQTIMDSCMCRHRRNEMITGCEVNVSSIILGGGGNIASMQNDYRGMDFRKKENLRCGGGRSPVSCQPKDPAGSPACKGSDPCAELFVKYGGTNIALGFIPPKLHEKVTAVEARGDTLAKMCRSGPERPTQHLKGPRPRGAVPPPN